MSIKSFASTTFMIKIPGFGGNKSLKLSSSCYLLISIRMLFEFLDDWLVSEGWTWMAAGLIFMFFTSDRGGGERNG